MPLFQQSRITGHVHRRIRIARAGYVLIIGLPRQNDSVYIARSPAGTDMFEQALQYDPHYTS